MQKKPADLVTEENPINPEVQHVVAVRAENQLAGVGDQPAQTIASLGEKTGAVLSSGAGEFFTTIKRMLLLGLVLALAAAWWAEEGSVLRGIGAALLVFIPVAAVALVLAGQRAAVAVGVQTWRQTGLARKLLDLLLDDVAAAPAEDAPASPLAATTAPGRLPIAEACARLSRAVKDWKGNSAASSSLIRRSQDWIAGLIERIVSTSFQSYVGKGGVDLNEVRQDLSVKIDDLVATHVQKRTRGATAGAVIAAVVWALLVAYTLQRLAHL